MIACVPLVKDIAPVFIMRKAMSIAACVHYHNFATRLLLHVCLLAPSNRIHKAVSEIAGRL